MSFNFNFTCRTSLVLSMITYQKISAKKARSLLLVFLNCGKIFVPTYLMANFEEMAFWIHWGQEIRHRETF